MASNRKILIVAYSGKGHINPSLRFANRLLKQSVDVTFATSLSVIQRINMKTVPKGLTFAPFSDGHDAGKHPNTPLLQFISDFEITGSRAVAEIIISATNAGQSFDCVIYTTVIPWAARVAHAHDIKHALLWCQSATILDIYYYYFNEYQSLISSNNNNPAFPINLPGLPPLTISDLPSFLLSTCPKEHEFLVPVLKDHIDVLKLSPRVLVNTVDELEFDSIRAIEKLELLPIGPLIPSDSYDRKDSSDYSLGVDFFDKTDDSQYDYIQWLNTQQKSSVVYVSFGTIATFKMEQLEEMANGLMAIGRPFLWVIRDSEQAERMSKIDGLQKQGLIVGWCSQVEVFSHQAVGCVVMHCGWNSTVEVLVAGIPTVVFPQWSDQGTDAKMIEDVWKIGVRVRTREEDGMVEGKEIKRCVEMVMGNEQMKINALKWKEVMREALINGGPATINLQTFLHDLGN